MKVLNPGLYLRLAARYGSVKVHGQGEQTQISPVPNPLEFGKPRVTTSGGEHYAVDCPFCGGSKTLWVNNAYGDLAAGRTLWHPVVCYRCHVEGDGSGRLYTELQKLMSQPVCKIQAAALQATEADTRKLTDMEPWTGYPLTDPRVPEILERELLDRRSMTLAQLSELGVYWSPKRPSFPYPLAFPAYVWKEDGSWAYAGLQARFFQPGLPDPWDPGDDHKWHTQSGFKCKNVLYGLPQVLQRAAVEPVRRIYLVEGPLDVARHPGRSLGTYGKNWSPAQVQLLMRAWPNPDSRPELVVAYDRDAWYPTKSHLTRDVTKRRDKLGTLKIQWQAPCWHLEFDSTRDPGDTSPEDLDQLAEAQRAS